MEDEADCVRKFVLFEYNCTPRPGAPGIEGCTFPTGIENFAAIKAPNYRHNGTCIAGILSWHHTDLCGAFLRTKLASKERISLN
jgi:hypothetical protein